MHDARDVPRQIFEFIICDFMRTADPCDPAAHELQKNISSPKAHNA